MLATKSVSSCTCVKVDTGHVACRIEQTERLQAEIRGRNVRYRGKKKKKKKDELNYTDKEFNSSFKNTPQSDNRKSLGSVRGYQYPPVLHHKE